MDVRLIVLPACAILIYNTCGHGLALEADYSSPQSAVPEIPCAYAIIPDFQFRTDRVTTNECRKFKYLIPCSPVGDQLSCHHVSNYHGAPYGARSKTYLAIECYERDRSEMIELVRNVSGESPTRAIIVTLQEREGVDNLIHADVFDPMRNQVIEFTAKCPEKMFTDHPDATSKVYNVGVLPNLFRLVMKGCRNLVIKKQDFTRLPKILMIAFEASAIDTLEWGTLANLPTLQNLCLTTDGSWFRNLTREKSYLFEPKQQGEVFIIGNYLSPAVDNDYACRSYRY